MTNQSSIQGACTEYERLLTKSDAALTTWANTRAGISARLGSDTHIHDHLQALQRDFLKVWELLEDHKRHCEVCQVASIQGTVHSVTDGGLRQQLYH
jgi:hypothetical protein